MFVPRTKFLEAIPFGISDKIASILLLQDLESDLILSRSNSTKD